MVAAQQSPTLQDNMDSQQAILHSLPGKVQTQILLHAVDRQHYRHGLGAERIRLICPAGHSAQFAYRLPNAPVLNELHFSAWVMCNRPGMQLAATVVLPRSINPATGRPYEILTRGGTIGQGNGWEQLSLNDLPKLVERMARVARSQYGSSLDERGAFVSQLILLAPGGKGPTECLVDQIEVYGIVGAWNNQASSATKSEIAAPSSQKTFRIPKVIQWQGEPFELLSKLGFDAVGMKRLPSPEELQEARTSGLVLVCPPPSPHQLTQQGIPDELACIFAWDFGDQLSSDDLDHIIRWQQLLKRFDSADSRPTLITPRLFTREASRLADGLMVGRTMLGTDTSLQDHVTWLTQRRRLALPGTDLWAIVDTQLSPAQAIQFAALQAAPATTAEASYQQLAALTSAAFTIKSRGFYFASHSSLAAADPATGRRAKAIQLNNLRLDLAEPWLASGKVLDVARCSQPQLNALVLKAERSHLLVPIHWSSSMQSLPTASDAGSLAYTVPGVGESAEAYLLTLGGSQRLRHRRVTGGVRVTVESLPSDALILLTDDPQAFSQVTRYLRQIAPQATRLRRDLAAQRLQELSTSLQASPSEQPNHVLQRATFELQACDQLLTQGSNDLAYVRADAVDQLLNRLDLASHVSGATAGTIAATAGQVPGQLARAPVGANLLGGGGFENLSAMIEMGWRHRQLSVDGVASAVRLSPSAPHSGSYCLELEAHPTDTTAPITVVPASPVWITSAPVKVQAGDLVEITGVARVPEPLLGSVDGLQLIDSLGGPEMALRIPQAPSWQPFRIVRSAPHDEEVTVSIALSGLGKAQIDDLAIRTTRVPASTDTRVQSR